MNQPPKGVNICEAPMVIHWQRWTSDRDFGMPGRASVTVDQIFSNKMGNKPSADFRYGRRLMRLKPRRVSARRYPNGRRCKISDA